MGRKIKKDLIVRKVSKASGIRKDVVDHVYDSMIDVFIEEIINEGRLVIPNVATFKTTVGHKVVLNGETFPERKILRVSLSRTIKELWRVRMGPLSGGKGLIRFDNWREVLELSRGSNQPEKKREASDADFNPLIDDDSEDF